MKIKDANQLYLFGTEVWYEYLLVISPDKPIRDAVDLRKRKAGELVGTRLVFAHSHPHISLLTFTHAEHEWIMEKICAVLASQQNFGIQLCGADFYKSPASESRTLIIPVSENAFIKILADEIKKKIRTGTKYSPHMTVVEGISGKDFGIINPLLNDFKFDGEFSCSGITVLRRLKNDSDPKWSYSDDIAFGKLILESV